MAGGGGGGVEVSLLETPTYTTAVVLAVFLAASLAFERGSHWLVGYFERRKRAGLAAAVRNLVTELSLVGFISLLLVVLQEPISRICISYDPDSWVTWSLLANVAGCDCCVAATKYVAPCFKVDRACGPEFCNCEGRDPACVTPPPTLQDIWEEYQSNATCAEAPCSELVARAVALPQAAQADSLAVSACDGMVQLGSGSCGEGKAPLISVTALHEVHLLIFFTALLHVVMAALMVVLASWRVRRWRRTCAAEEDDEHVQRVREILDEQRAAQAPPSTRWHRLRSTRFAAAFGSGLSRTLTGLTSRARGPSLPSSPTAAAAERAERGGARPSLDSLQPGSPAAAGAGLAAVKEEGSANAGSCTPGKDVSSHGSGSAAPPLPEPAPAAAEGEASVPARDGGDASARAADGAPPGEDGVPAASEQQVPAPAKRAAPVHETASFGVLPAGGAAPLEASSDAPPADEPALQPQSSVSTLERRRRGLVGQTGRFFLKRQSTLKRGDHKGHLTEAAICFLHQFNPRPIASEDVRLMRASFILTHRVPPGFDFWDYVAASMEDDFSRVVGIGVEMWVTLVIFVFISGPIGWAALIFICLAAVVLVVTNMKLMTITRHVCRGARANVLQKETFWFHRPGLMLIPIRFLLFLCSFMFASSAFFALTFGSQSCPFTSVKNKFWLGWSAGPWWLSLVFSGLLFLDASLRTLPCYSLAVQMGSDFKHHMLPKGVREKLLLIAQNVKAKHKAMEAEAAAREGSRRGGLLGGLSRKTASGSGQ